MSSNAQSAIGGLLQQIVSDAVRAVVRDEIADLRSEIAPSAPPPPQPGKLMTVGEAAAMLGISTATLYKPQWKDKITSVKVGGRVMYRPEDLEAFIKQQQQGRAPTVEMARAIRRR